jgi:hypothetical protein
MNDESARPRIFYRDKIFSSHTCTHLDMLIAWSFSMVAATLR